MVLVFFLQRPNVFPLDDLGLLKGLSLHYAGGEPLSRSQARDVGELWAPWATVGTWYIWESLKVQKSPLETATVESKLQ
jgi:DNA-3-methyladenine glycosylase II